MPESGGQTVPTIIPSLPHMGLALGEEGDNSPRVGIRDDTRQVGLADPNPVGNRAGRKGAVVRWRILRAKVSNLTRHPYIVAMNAYLSDIRSVVGEGTVRERKSKLLYLFETMVDLRLKTDPREIGEAEIHALVQWMRDKNHLQSYQAKLWQYLKGFLDYVDNPILHRMKAQGKWRGPKRVYRGTEPKDDAWFKDVVDRLGQQSDWRERMVLGACALYWHTSGRVKEIRKVSMEDIDLRTREIVIRHPKGEGAWASDSEKVRIMHPGDVFLADYLNFREARLKQLELDPAAVKALFPNERGDFYTESGWRMARCKVFKRHGIAGNYRVFRASFAQRLKDKGAPIEAVSKALRHQTTATTENFYARLRPKSAWDQVETIWDKPEVKVSDDSK